MSRHPVPRRARYDGDGGAALVEFALVLPLLAMFALGIIEYGSVYRADDQVQQALMSSGRVAAQGSNGALSDYHALRALDSSLSGLKRATIKKVVIYNATGNGKAPADCLAVVPSGGASGVSGKCNVYSPAQVATESPASFSFTSPCSGAAWDSNWCPFSRDPQTQKIGVYVELTYKPLTGIIPKTTTISRYTVYAVEPSQIQAGG